MVRLAPWEMNKRKLRADKNHLYPCGARFSDLEEAETNVMRLEIDLHQDK